jgi:hypothetical protein
MELVSYILQYVLWVLVYTFRHFEIQIDYRLHILHSLYIRHEMEAGIQRYSTLPV